MTPPTQLSETIKPRPVSPRNDEPDFRDGACPQIYAAHYMAAAFLSYGLTATVLLAVIVPPFQVPDEPNHFMRAAQIADGTLIGSRVAVVGANGLIGGGSVDPAILSAAAPFDAVRFHPDQRVKRADWEPRIRWSRTRIATAFPNTAMYPPFFYLPSALGILIGRAAHWTILQTLILSRFLTGATAVTLGAAAIVIADGAAAWIFTILTLPMTLFLFASVSQDALILACSALAGSCLVRLLRLRGPGDPKLIGVLVIMLGLVAMARPPYGTVLLLPIGLTRMPIRWRVMAAMTIAALVVIWSTIAAIATWTPFFSVVGADPGAQLTRLITDPVLIARVAFATVSRYGPYYVAHAIGVLGWLDTSLPRAYYGAAVLMLGVAAVAAMLGTGGKRMRVHSALTVAATVAASSAAIFVTQYLIWTVPGNPLIEGVEGRYFLPIALIGTAILPSLRESPAGYLRNPLAFLVVTFPLLSLGVMVHAIVSRYYLG
jgi:Predicted membrane protein (DUF2142)